MTPHDHNDSNLSALLPFAIGDAEILLIPNQREGSGAGVMLITRSQGVTISNQIPLVRARQFAAYLQTAADEAEEMASSGVDEERERFRRTIKLAVYDAEHRQERYLGRIHQPRIRLGKPGRGL